MWVKAGGGAAAFDLYFCFVKRKSGSSRERDVPQYRVSGMGEAPQSSPGGRLFFQPCEANFVENLRTPGVLRPQK